MRRLKRRNMFGLEKRRYYSARAKAWSRYSRKKNPHDSGGISIWTILLVGVGGYFLYNWWASLSTPAATTTTTTPGTTAGTATQPTSLSTNPIDTNAGTTTTAPTVLPPVNLSGTLTTYLVANGYSANQTFNAFQWDYLAARALGSSYITLSQLPSLVGANIYTMSQYLAAYGSSGVSGLGCACGMGSISPSQIMYRKMLGRTSNAVGDFTNQIASKSETNWVN